MIFHECAYSIPVLDYGLTPWKSSAHACLAAEMTPEMALGNTDHVSSHQSVVRRELRIHAEPVSEPLLFLSNLNRLNAYGGGRLGS